MRFTYLSWKDRRKKSWRKIRSEKEKVIRRLCLAAIALESAWGIRSWDRASLWKEYSVTEEREYEGTENGPERDRRKSIYGISFELKEGKIRIYRQAEYWKEENKTD